MQSIGDWYYALPEPYQSKARAYAGKHKGLTAWKRSLEDALAWGFRWDHTEEGMNFWLEVSLHAQDPDQFPLPEFPINNETYERRIQGIQDLSLH